MTQRGAPARSKGIRYERAVVDLFREAMPDATIRRGIQSRSGAEVADIDMPCFWPEVKRHKQTNPRAALRQAAEACPPGRWPIAICKDDGEQPFVTMQLPDFLDLVSEWWEARQ
ncbi:MAG: hypothetical protein AB7S68_08240 [Polyangiaceae bacterium]